MAQGFSAGNSFFCGNILKEKTGYAKRRFKDIVNILPGYDPLKFAGA
jgi:hypothetical protein